MNYSFEVGIPSDEGLEDVRVEQEGLICDLEAEVIEELSSFLNVSFFGVSLGHIMYTEALFDGIGGIYMPMNRSTNLFLNSKNSLNLLLMKNSPCGSFPETR